MTQQTRYSEIKTKRRARFNWDEFDALPGEVRTALNNAALCYATSELAKGQRAGRSAAVLVLSIQEADEKFLTQLAKSRAGEIEVLDAKRLLKELGL